MAGLTVPAVCARIPERISALVLVAAAVAPPAGTLLDLLPAPIRLLCRVLLRFGGLAPALPRPMARYMFCNDMTPEQTQRTLQRVTPDAVQVVVEPMPLPELPSSLPVTYLRFTRDQVMTAPRARRMVENLGGATTLEVDAGHDGMITRPEQVAAVLKQVAEQRLGR
jgi:pimeloyl-ACP methyl ester carboxylesterase